MKLVQGTLFEEDRKAVVIDHFDEAADVVFVQGDSLSILAKCPDGFATLIITSPPYNIGKEYETQTKLGYYLNQLQPILEQLVRVLSPNGSLCWQLLFSGQLPYRPLGKPVYQPTGKEKVSQIPKQWIEKKEEL